MYLIIFEDQEIQKSKEFPEELRPNIEDGSLLVINITGCENPVYFETEGVEVEDYKGLE